MANPSKIRAITESKSKTDEKDSLVLAQFLRLGYIPRSYVPTAEIMRNRELLYFDRPGYFVNMSPNR